MGMFNFVKVENELLPERFRHIEFQTKCELEDLRMETFTITKEGRLIFERCVYEFKPDPEKEKLGGIRALAGSIKIASSELVDENYHGYIDFYGDEWFCTAKFTNGQLEDISYHHEGA